jgi:hydrogenase nickel incorporation protein HypA/HybF
VLQHAQQANANLIEDIHIVIGELSTNVDDSIQFYWGMVAKGTMAEEARLHFRRVPAQMQCVSCKHIYHPEDGELPCPDCGNAGAGKTSLIEQTLPRLKVKLRIAVVDGDIATSIDADRATAAGAQASR